MKPASKISTTTLKCLKSLSNSFSACSIPLQHLQNVQSILPTMLPRAGNFVTSLPIRESRNIECFANPDITQAKLVHTLLAVVSRCAAKRYFLRVRRCFVWTKASEFIKKFSKMTLLRQKNDNFNSVHRPQNMFPET